MGLPAKRIEPRAGRASRPRLRLVAPPTGRPARGRCSAQQSAAAARQVLLMFTVVVASVAILGMGRVWLSARAAEASIEAGRLRAAIKEARYAGDMLEVRQSALGSPSRIRAIAGEAFGMAPAAKVTYLDLRTKKGAPGPVAVRPPARPDSGLDSFIASALDLAAGEAQVLLVGDVGLASAR